MSAIAPLAPPVHIPAPANASDLNVLHKATYDLSGRINWIALPTILLITLSALVILCTSLCLTLPGVNTLTILPYIVSGGCGIALSIPPIVLLVKKSSKMNAKRQGRCRGGW